MAAFTLILPSQSFKRQPLRVSKVHARWIGAFFLLLTLYSPPPAAGQYIYLDYNGDGRNDSQDGRLQPGNQWVDLWLVTDRNRDGSPANCIDQVSPMSFDEYSVVLQSSGPGEAHMWAYEDYMGFPQDLSTTPFTLQCHIGKRGTAMVPPGRYMLGRVGLSVTGTPLLRVIPMVTEPVSAVYLTAFRSQCAGVNADHYIKLGTDFTDTDGLNGTDNPPTLAVLGQVSCGEGGHTTINARATDPDAAQSVTITASVSPPANFLSQSGCGPGPSPVTCAVFVTPGFEDAGTYWISWKARDSYSAFVVDSATTELTITNTDRTPVVTAPASESVDEGATLSFSVTARDPDGDAIQSLDVSPHISDATFTVSLDFTSGVFTWTPSFTQAGDYNLSFTASNLVTGFGTTVVSVRNVNDPPAVSGPTNVSAYQGDLVRFDVSVSDPDGEPIGALVVSDLPSGAVFVPNAAATLGTFSWTPSYTQSGLFFVTFTASNALSGNLLTTIQVFAVSIPSAGYLKLRAANPAPGGFALEYGIGQPSRASLRVFDAAGRLVRELFDADLPKGIYQATWDGRRADGQTAPAGVYHVFLSSSGHVHSTKVVLLR